MNSTYIYITLQGQPCAVVHSFASIETITWNYKELDELKLSAIPLREEDYDYFDKEHLKAKRWHPGRRMA